MADVFISYRRDDSRSAVGRLSDHLNAALGDGRVFRDLDDIAAGDNFEAALARAIGGARVLLAVVGPRWLDAAHADGRRRLDDTDDPVRREIEGALSAGVPVIPVLVEGARMPRPEALPPSLGAFARLQAVTLDDARWAADGAALVAGLRARHGVEPVAGAGASASGGVAGTLHDLLELAVRPRRVILRLAGGGARTELLRALVLLAACVVVGNVLVGAVIADGLAEWVGAGLLVALPFGTLAIALVGAAWAIAGVRVGWQRLAAGGACFVAGLVLYAALGGWIVALGFALDDPQTFDTLRAKVRSGAADADAVVAFAEARAHGAALGGAMFAVFVWLGTAAWALAAWAALALAFGAGVVRALGAAAVALALPVALAALVAWASS